MSVSVPLSTYLELTERAEQTGQSLSFIVNRLLLAALGLEKELAGNTQISRPA